MVTADVLPDLFGGCSRRACRYEKVMLMTKAVHWYCRLRDGASGTSWLNGGETMQQLPFCPSYDARQHGLFSEHLKTTTVAIIFGWPSPPADTGMGGTGHEKLPGAAPEQPSQRCGEALFHRRTRVYQCRCRDCWHLAPSVKSHPVGGLPYHRHLGTWAAQPCWMGTHLILVATQFLCAERFA